MPLFENEASSEATQGAPSPVDRVWRALLGPTATSTAHRAVERLGLAARGSSACLELSALVEDADFQAAAGPSSIQQVVGALVGSGAAVRAVGFDLEENQGHPLVIDESQRLYFRRLYQAECDLARDWLRLSVGAAQDGTPMPAERINHYFPLSERGGGSDGQRRAAESCLSSGATLITGGPGTGKTTTVVKILALLIEKGLRAGRPPKILLLAPTGKAADRLMEAVRQSAGSIELPAEVRAHFPTSASTVHRALDAGLGNGSRFRRGRDSPILADCVIVDEASMLDLSLTAHLLGALRDSTRLIFLGDPDQLASVDAGSVLADLLKATEALAAGAPERRASSIRLLESYRFNSGGALAELARRVQRGEGEGVLELLLAGRSPDVSWLDVSNDPRWQRRAIDAFAERYRPVLSASGPDEALQILNRFRVLAAVRAGPAGVDMLSAGIAAKLERSHSSHAYFQGQPLLVTENDPRLGLFNGDVGMVWKSQAGTLVAHFWRAGQGTFRVPLAALPAHESAFVLTVHKSQGSEYDEVAFVLPETVSPVVSRELIYTALTRARRMVSIWGSPPCLRAGVERPTRRSSGLADRIVQLARKSSSTP